MNEELNLKQIIEILLPKWAFILIGCIVLSMVSYLYSAYMIDPVYVSQGSLYITGTVDSIKNSKKQDTELSDLMISQELSRTYGQFLSSNTFFKQVAKESNTKFSYEQLKRMTRISNVENTGILQVSVSNTDPMMANKIANTILKCAPKEIERIVVAGSATIIEDADIPRSPSSPNIPRNTVVGGVAGLILSVLIVFLQNMFDKSIKSAEEIKDIFGLPVLGMVPEIDPHHIEGEKKDARKSKSSEKK